MHAIDCLVPRDEMRSRLSAGVRGCSPCAQKAVVMFAVSHHFRSVLLALQYSCSSAKFFIPNSEMITCSLHKSFNRLWSVFI